MTGNHLPGLLLVGLTSSETTTERILRTIPAAHGPVLPPIKDPDSDFWSFPDHRDFGIRVTSCHDLWYQAN